VREEISEELERLKERIEKVRYKDLAENVGFLQSHIDMGFGVGSGS